VRIPIVVVIAASQAGCINVVAGSDGPGRRPGLVPLYSASVEPDGVHIVADSHGCTAEDSFEPLVYRDGGNPGSKWYHVRFDRLSVDRCDNLVPGGVELVYTFTRLGLPSDARIVVDNPTNR
jgi:hypothetical protein